MVQVCIHDQPEKFTKDERTIDWISSLMDKYVAARHSQWINETLSVKLPESITRYIQALQLRFEH
jgi:hypothetical protein